MHLDLLFSFFIYKLHAVCLTLDMILQAHVEYETAKRHYAHVDCPGHADYVKVRCEWTELFGWNEFG